MKKNLIISLICVLGVMTFLGGMCSKQGENKDKKGDKSILVGKSYTIIPQDKELGEKFEGIVKIDQTSKNDEIIAHYHFLIHDELSNNGKCGIGEEDLCGGNTTYEYVTKLKNQKDSAIENIFQPAYCKEKELPQNMLELIYSHEYTRAGCGLDTTKVSPEVQDFYIYIKEIYKDPDDFFEFNRLHIHDSSEFWEKVKYKETKTKSPEIDVEKALKKGDLEKEYPFEIIE